MNGRVVYFQSQLEHLGCFQAILTDKTRCNLLNSWESHFDDWGERFSLLRRLPPKHPKVKLFSNVSNSRSVWTTYWYILITSRRASNPTNTTRWSDEVKQLWTWSTKSGHCSGKSADKIVFRDEDSWTLKGGNISFSKETQHQPLSYSTYLTALGVVTKACKILCFTIFLSSTLMGLAGLLVASQAFPRRFLK